jgi:hypothetical protein
VSAGLSTYDFSVTADGKRVMTGGKGTFDVSSPNHPDVGCTTFLGDASVSAPRLQRLIRARIPSQQF